MRTVLLLIASNVFMTIAWYGHLRFKEAPLWKAVVVSWLIAFVEYCLQVPANRLGYGTFSGYQLKVIQEIITVMVFIAFAAVWLRESLRWNYAVALLLIVGAAFFAFGIRPQGPAP